MPFPPPSIAALAGLAFITIPAQGLEILREEFTVTAISPLADLGWSAYLTQMDTAVVDWSSEPATGSVSAIASGDYAFYRPAGDAATFNVDGPGIIFTPLAGSHPISSITSISVDENMDASVADPAAARFVIEVGGQWYASDFIFTSDTELGAGGAFATVSLDNIDFADGANWRLLTVAVGGAGVGELTLAGAPVGGTLSGDLTKVGLYSLPGNGGDHSRFDNFVVNDSTPTFVETFQNDGSVVLPFSSIGWNCLLTENDQIVSYDKGGTISAAGIAGPDYGFFAAKQDPDVPFAGAVDFNDPALITTSKPGPADISSLKLVSWLASADNADDEYRVAIQVGGVWYASEPALNDGQEDSGSNFVPLSFSPASFAAAGNWLTIENATVGDPDPLSLGAAPGLDLTGNVTAYGLYVVSGINNEPGDHVRFDDFTVAANFIVEAGLKITSFTSVGGGLWEVILEGAASTACEFRSSTTLEFTPGTLVENLTQGDPGDAGAISSANGGVNNVITTDTNGAAKVRVLLSGSPSDFVRAQSAP